MQIQLRTIGAKSGRGRTVTLYAWPDGDDLVLVGSSGGSARHPAWVHNLRGTPRATLVRGRREVAVGAREINDPGERERVWRLVVDAFPLYETYQRRTVRRIPLFVLSEVDASTE